MAKTNFDCMICDSKSTVKEKGFHLGICKKCTQDIKENWDEKNNIIISDDNPM